MPLYVFIILAYNAYAQGRGGARAGMKNEKRLSPRHLEQFVVSFFMFFIYRCFNCIVICCCYLLCITVI